MARLVAGLDEVGWGAAAGPIVSVVAVFREGQDYNLPKGVTDSKKLSSARREAFFLPLCHAALDVGIGAVFPSEVDSLSPKFALQESYARALTELRAPPDLLIVDGTDWTNKVQAFCGQQLVVPKADLLHVEVSVASIIAKVVRDTLMVQLAAKRRASGLPDYNWAGNKGYLTSDHVAEIKKHGLLFGPDEELYLHRRSYCGNLIGKVPVVGRQTIP